MKSAQVFSQTYSFLFFFLPPKTHYLSVYEDLGWWRAVASDCRIICEFHFSSPRGDLFIVLQEPTLPRGSYLFA